MALSIVVVAVVVAVVGGVLLRGHGRSADRSARLLRRSGFVLMTVVTFGVGVFLVGETVDDPGGRQAVLLILAWAVPLLALATLAWLRPAGLGQCSWH